ncbi:MAG: hypothetical protein BMS9Abin13_031 [Patescibacteria group bacterium]|nr:MAG: hypothetical protein BMS9Abin13_031 [Patescibacteria group bacterium]
MDPYPNQLGFLLLCYAGSPLEADGRHRLAGGAVRNNPHSFYLIIK